MLTATKLHGADDEPPAVEPDLLADAREVVEGQPPGGDELLAVVRVIDAAEHQRPRTLTRSPQRSQRWKRSVKKNGRRRRGSR